MHQAEAPDAVTRLEERDKIWREGVFAGGCGGSADGGKLAGEMEEEEPGMCVGGVSWCWPRPGDSRRGHIILVHTGLVAPPLFCQEVRGSMRVLSSGITTTSCMVR